MGSWSCNGSAIIHKSLKLLNVKFQSGTHWLTKGNYRATRAVDNTKYSNTHCIVRGTWACCQTTSRGKTGTETNSCLHTAGISEKFANVTSEKITLVLGILDKHSILRENGTFVTWVWFTSTSISIQFAFQLLQGLTTAFDPLSSGNKEDSGDLLQVEILIHCSYLLLYNLL